MVDHSLNDMPVIAWTNFETEHRETLHENINCEIRLFHYAAEMILERTLDAMEILLSEELEDDLPKESSDILPFKKD